MAYTVSLERVKTSLRLSLACAQTPFSDDGWRNGAIIPQTLAELAHSLQNLRRREIVQRRESPELMGVDGEMGSWTGGLGVAWIVISEVLGLVEGICIESDSVSLKRRASETHHAR